MRTDNAIYETEVALLEAISALLLYLGLHLLQEHCWGNAKKGEDGVFAKKIGMGHLRFTYLLFVRTGQFEVFILVPFEIWSSGIVPDYIAFALRREL